MAGKSSYVWPAVAGASLVVGVLLYLQWGGGEATVADAARIVSELNAKLPAMADAGTRLDSVELGDDEIVYNYAMVDYTSADLPRGQMEAMLGPQLRKAACTASMMKPLFKSGFSARYLYYGKDKRLITEMTVKPGDCGLASVESD